jgi:hypothetical protein
MIGSLFDVFVFPGILSRHARLAASRLAALGNLASSLPEMLQCVAVDASVRAAFEAHGPEAVTALLAFALRLIEAGDASLLGDRRFVRFLKVSLHLANGVSHGALRILAEILRKGFPEFVTEHGFDDMALTALGADAPFEVKRAAMVVLCMDFGQVTNTDKGKDWGRGIGDVNCDVVIENRGDAPIR